MSVIDELISRSVKRRMTDVEEEQLAMWRSVSPANELYFQELSRLLRAATHGDSIVGAPKAADLIELAGIGRSDDDRRRPRQALPVWGYPLLIAATITLVALGGLWYHARTSIPAFQLGAGEFVTGPSETGTVTLSDGSVVRMAPRSRLRVLDTPDRRDVFLTGKAYFAVAKMERYPFRVRTHAGDATALGTRFEVKVTEEVRVVVAEGRVAFQGGTGAVELGAGEMSILLSDAPSAPVKVDVAPLLEWVGRFVAFQSTPLHRVATELEREYGRGVVIADSALLELTITGRYIDRSFEEVITIICSVLGAPCSIENGTATIGSPSTNGGRAQ